MNKIAIRNNFSEQALELIKSTIFSLTYPPGTRLIVDNLASEFNISRTPIREALKELVIQGLVDYDGIKYSVIDLDKREVNEIYTIRSVLESQAAEKAAVLKTPEQLIAMQQISIEALQAEDMCKIIDLDMEFHTLIAQASQNKRLTRIISMLMDQSKLINCWLYSQNSSKELEKATIKEHLSILEKIQEGDSTGAAEEMKNHLKQAEIRATK